MLVVTLIIIFISVFFPPYIISIFVRSRFLIYILYLYLYIHYIFFVRCDTKFLSIIFSKQRAWFTILCRHSDLSKCFSMKFPHFSLHHIRINLAIEALPFQKYLRVTVFVFYVKKILFN